MLLGIGLQGRVERTNGVGEPAAEDQLATVQEVVQRGHGLDPARLLDSRGPGPRGRPRARGTRRGGGGTRPSSSGEAGPPGRGSAVPRPGFGRLR